MKSIRTALLAVLVLLSPSLYAQADKTVIRIANLDIAPFLAVGYVEKLAAKHGIQVKVTNFRRGLEAAQALKAGEADVAVGGVEAAISAIAGGAPGLIISSTTTGGIAWVSRPDLNIQSIADLKGKKFGVIRGLHELVLLKTLEQLSGLIRVSATAGNFNGQQRLAPSLESRRVMPIERRPFIKVKGRRCVELDHEGPLRSAEVSSL